MRIRTTKPEFWRSQDMAKLTRELRLLFIGLWSYVDDNGVGIDDFRAIAADLFGLEDDPADSREYVRDGLETLSRGLQIVRYQAGGKPYLFIVNWDKHQRIDKPAKPRYPRPQNVPTRIDANPEDPFATPSRVSPETVAPGTGEQGNRGTGEPSLRSGGPRKRGTRIPDDFAVSAEMVEWARERVPHVDGRLETEKFINHWIAKSGKDATKLDWVATWRNWMLNANSRLPARASPNGMSPTDAAITAFAARHMPSSNLIAIQGGAS